MAYNACPDGPLGSRRVRRQGSRNRTPDIIFYVHKFLLTAEGGERKCSGGNRVV